ncbi:glycosyltransferase [Salininema proteolyticum]|uniref:Glycosyltransferase n=1 Tax=Salininema proteolyticum TaxID=1607685 RepID=A0ABV8U368_9ACTN
MTGSDRTRRPRILYLCFYFPPSRASGVYRGVATANVLARSGWDVTVLAAPERFFRLASSSVDESLSGAVDPSVTVRRPEIDYFPWETDVRRMSWLRCRFPEVAARRYERKRERGFPERYASWGDEAVKTGRGLHRRSPFDAVLATGNPYAAFAAAWRLNRATGVPYVLDNRDAWTLDLFENRDKFKPGHPAWEWEERFMRTASGVCFVNEALRAWHRDRYPYAAEKMHVVPNGWDPGTVDIEEASRAPGGPGDRVRFGYLGTLTKQQPVEPLLEAFELFLGEGGRPASVLDFHGYLEFTNPGKRAMLEILGLTGEPHERRVGRGEVRYRGPAPKTAVAEVYRDLDVLVFLAGGSRYVTSGKVFEYMATGKPVVSVHAPGSAAEEYLRDYPCWVRPDSLDPSDIAKALRRAADLAAAPDDPRRLAARAYGARFTRENSLADLVGLLDSLAAPA